MTERERERQRERKRKRQAERGGEKTEFISGRYGNTTKLKIERATICE